MRSSRNLIVTRWSDPDLNGAWGIYSVDDDDWLPVTYSTMKEAEAVAQMLTSNARIVRSNIR